MLKPMPPLLIYSIKIVKLILFICFSQTLFCQFNKQGYAIQTQRFFDSSKNTYLFSELLPEFKLWYRNSVSIREIDSIYHEEVSGKTTKYSVNPQKYFFIDLRTRIFYEYAKLNKNEPLVKSFQVVDTMKMLYPSIYIFFGSKDSASRINMPNEKYFEIPDTLIEGIKYKRLKCLHQVNYHGKSYKNVWIPYFRYDIKKSILHLSKEFDEKMNWPMVKLEVFDVKFRTLLEINYVRSELTKEENEIFDAWERNAKLNRITK